MTVAILIGAVLIAGFLIGRAQGLSSRPKVLPPIPLHEKCSCSHGNNIHADNGRGSCEWKRNDKDGTTWHCQCMRFTMKDPFELE